MTRRSKPLVVIATATLLTALGVTAAAGPASAKDRPDVIDLPLTFSGEGVATGTHHTFYVGDRVNGTILRGDLRDATTEVFVGSPLVPAATGLKADIRHGLLWVSGAQTGQAAVYDLSTGAGVATLTLTTGTSFINDVVVTHDAAYFTNSFAAEIYRVPVSPRGEVGAPETIPLSGPAATIAPGFNLNGIEATDNGGTLIVVNSALGTLYTVDARTGASTEIDLGGGSVPTGDGILRAHGNLLVMQNGGGAFPSQVAVVDLRNGLTEGRIVDIITNPFFETATTLARDGGTLVAVNAQFAPPTVDAEPEVVLFRHH